MAPRARLDAELVRRGLARSREQARDLITDGQVTVNGVRASKPATNVSRDTPILLTDTDTEKWASRGAHKIIGALGAFAPDASGAGGVRVEGRRCLDAGASTGGFTDVLLRRGASRVVAADVGYGQLVWRLQSDDRVDVRDRVNVRHLTADDIGGPVELIVADLSFISLRLVLPAFARCIAPGGDLLPMVKPQFEVGKERVGTGGVVRDPALRAGAVSAVAARAQALGLRTMGVVASPLPGPSGNVEYFLWLRNEGTVPVVPDVEAEDTLLGGVPDEHADRSSELDDATLAAITTAIEKGPQ